MMLHKNASLLL